MRSELVRASRFISLVLRHEPSAAGLVLDAQGWASLDALFSGARAAGIALDRSALAAIFAESDKARFELSLDGSRIRAVHGHSVAVETQGEPETPPDELFHGTAQRLVTAILREGLKPGARQFVHLSAGRDMALSVGARHGRPVVPSVDAAGMAQARLEFFRSSSGVWLTRSVPAAYLKLSGEGL